MKPSEVIRKAIDHPDYLASCATGHGVVEPWLCNIIRLILDDDREVDRLSSHIYKSFKGELLFLRMHLVEIGVLPGGTKYSSPEYKEAAMKHWENLIDNLKERGL